MAKSDVALKRTESVGDQLEQMRDQIRRRAYDLFRTNGSPSPNPIEDWLTAEREMLRITAPIAETVRRQIDIGSER